MCEVRQISLVDQSITPEICGQSEMDRISKSNMEYPTPAPHTQLLFQCILTFCSVTVDRFHQ